MKENTNITFIIEFVDNILAKTLHHCNHIQNFRTVHSTFLELFDCAWIDVDFSENLSVPVKYEPQSLHRAHEQLSVHSGILTIKGIKSYHPYLSDNKVHDQVFVNEVLKEILNSADSLEDVSTIIIKSDNSNQYKSAQHFHDLQQLCNITRKEIIRVYGIAGHGKSEVNHMGGLAKVAVRKQEAAGALFMSAGEMVEFLTEKFQNKINPNYSIKEIPSYLLDEKRAMASLIAHPTIDGSSNFQVMVFPPDLIEFKAAERFCICLQCQSRTVRVICFLLIKLDHIS